MGTIQKYFRSMMSIGSMVSQTGGKYRGKKYCANDEFNQMFGKKGYYGPARLMLTLPPINKPGMRSDEQKARKKRMRQVKRLRINTCGH